MDICYHCGSDDISNVGSTEYYPICVACVSSKGNKIKSEQSRKRKRRKQVKKGDHKDEEKREKPMVESRNDESDNTRKVPEAERNEIEKEIRDSKEKR